jgi:hypothetical protein
MAFKVYMSADGNEYHEYGDKSVYEYLESGLLSVRPDTVASQTHVYSPSGWVYITADPDHKPGKPKGESDKTTTWMPRRIY